jgi:hypothetical protein
MHVKIALDFVFISTSHKIIIYFKKNLPIHPSKNQDLWQN